MATWLVAVTVISFVVTCVGATPANARVVSCEPSSNASLAIVLSVRNLSCSGTQRMLNRLLYASKLDVPIGLGRHSRINRYRCVVYRDATPPGPSDVYEFIRCVKGRKAFRFSYGT